MTGYTQELLAAIQRRVEDTEQSLSSIAAEFEIGLRTLQRMIVREGWKRRSDRPPRDLPAAMKVLEEARALTLPPRSGGEGRQLEQSESCRGGGNSKEPPTPAPPLASLVEGGEPASAISVPAEESAIDRLERLVLHEIDAEEAARRQLGGAPRMAREAEKAARRLSILTQTLHTLHRLRAPAIPEHMDADDDIPTNIDEFRLDLARRIEAFVASRTDGGGDPSDPEPPEMGDLR